MTSTQKKNRHPLLWVPSLYFAKELPFAAVSILAALMYKRMGISNEQIVLWTSLMGLAWVFKALWSPFLEIAHSRKTLVVAFEIVSGLSFLAVACATNLDGFFTFSVAFLMLASFASATHDVAADGSYIENLPRQRQSMYFGWLDVFSQVGRMCVMGGLVILAGYLEEGMSAANAWATVMAVLGGTLLILATYHVWAMPTREKNVARDVSGHFAVRTIRDAVTTFFTKPGIWIAILFVVLFQACAGQVTTIARLFLMDDPEAGGLGLNTYEMGIASGTLTSLALAAGSISAGYFVARRGLKQALFFSILTLNLPSLALWYLSTHPTTELYFITTVMSIESFGLGFGITSLGLYVMQVISRGNCPTSHYAFGTAIMQLAFSLSQMVSGKIEAWLGYRDFFIFGMLAALPVLIALLRLRIETTPSSDAATFEPAAIEMPEY